MGWSNYIIIEEWKLAIEVPQRIDAGSIEQEYLEKLLSFETREYLLEKPHSEITVKDLSEFVSAYDIIHDMADICPDELFLYWLESRKIGYKILSEFKFEEEKELKAKLRIIRLK